jgi:hypothetical protein
VIPSSTLPSWQNTTTRKGGSGSCWSARRSAFHRSPSHLIVLKSEQYRILPYICSNNMPHDDFYRTRWLTELDIPGYCRPPLSWRDQSASLQVCVVFNSFIFGHSFILRSEQKHSRLWCCCRIRQQLARQTFFDLLHETIHCCDNTLGKIVECTVVGCGASVLSGDYFVLQDGQGRKKQVTTDELRYVLTSFYLFRYSVSYLCLLESKFQRDFALVAPWCSRCQ